METSLAVTSQMTSTTPQPQLRTRKRKAPHDSASMCKTSICLRYATDPSDPGERTVVVGTPPLTAAAVRVALDLPDDWRLRVWDDECEAYVLCADEAQPIAQYAMAGGELQIALQPRAVRGVAGATPVPPPAWSRLGAPVSRGAYVSQHTAAPPRHAAAVASGGRVLELDDAADASHAALRPPPPPPRLEPVVAAAAAPLSFWRPATDDILAWPPPALRLAVVGGPSVTGADLVDDLPRTVPAAILALGEVACRL